LFSYFFLAEETFEDPPSYFLYSNLVGLLELFLLLEITKENLWFGVIDSRPSLASISYRVMLFPLFSLMVVLFFLKESFRLMRPLPMLSVDAFNVNKACPNLLFYIEVVVNSSINFM